MTSWRVRPMTSPSSSHSCARSAESFLHGLTGAVEHLGVETESGHDQKQAAVRRTGVEPPDAAGERDGQSAAEIDGQAEIASEKVPRAERNDGERDSGAGQACRACGDGAIAAAGQDQIGSGLRRHPGLPFTGIFGVVSSHIGSLHPCLAMAERTAALNLSGSSSFTGFTTTAARLTGSRCGVGPSWP